VSFCRAIIFSVLLLNMSNDPPRRTRTKTTKWLLEPR
jgi:hypothetical protein